MGLGRWVLACVAVAAAILFAASRDDENSLMSRSAMALLKMNTVKWHEGEAWAKMLSMYDERASRDFSNCTHMMLPTRFGQTQAHICGPDDAPPAFLFHGARGTAMSWAPVVGVEALRRQRRLIAIDYLCDAGRSVPTSCPGTAAEHADWVRDMFRVLGIERADLVGYSQGSFVSALVANEAPELVRSKVLLVAPAAVFSAITPGFWFHVLAMVLFKPLGFDMPWFWKWMTAPSFDVATLPKELTDFNLAIDDISYEYQQAMMPYSFSDEELRRLAAGGKTTLLYPEFETVTDRATVIERAVEAGVFLVIAENTGHGLQVEKPQWYGEKVAELLLA